MVIVRRRRGDRTGRRRSIGGVQRLDLVLPDQQGRKCARADDCHGEPSLANPPPAQRPGNGDPTRRRGASRGNCPQHLGRLQRFRRLVRGKRCPGKFDGGFLRRRLGRLDRYALGAAAQRVASIDSSRLTIDRRGEHNGFGRRVAIQRLNGSPVLCGPSKIVPVMRGPVMRGPVMRGPVMRGWWRSTKLGIVAGGDFRTGIVVSNRTAARRAVDPPSLLPLGGFNPGVLRHHGFAAHVERRIIVRICYRCHRPKRSKWRCPFHSAPAPRGAEHARANCEIIVNQDQGLRR